MSRLTPERLKQIETFLICDGCNGHGMYMENGTEGPYPCERCRTSGYQELDGVTVMDIIDELRALTAERDAAREALRDGTSYLNILASRFTSRDADLLRWLGEFVDRWIAKMRTKLNPQPPTAPTKE